MDTNKDQTFSTHKKVPMPANILDVYDNRNGTATLSIKCVMCRKTLKLEVFKSQYEKWQDGEYIQVAMPNLLPGERELLISGVCEPCFDAMYPE